MQSESGWFGVNWIEYDCIQHAEPIRYDSSKSYISRCFATFYPTKCTFVIYCVLTPFETFSAQSFDLIVAFKILKNELISWERKNEQQCLNHCKMPEKQPHYYLCKGVALCQSLRNSYHNGGSTEHKKKNSKTNDLPYVCVDMCSFILLNYIFRVANIRRHAHLRPNTTR